MTARDALDGMKQRLEAASIHDGPWAVEEDDTWGAKVYVRESGFGTMYICENLNQGEDGLADAAFIAEAPTDVARLIGAVEAVLARLDEWDSYKAWPDSEETQVWYSAGKRHASEAIRALITEALEEPR